MATWAGLVLLSIAAAPADSNLPERSGIRYAWKPNASYLTRFKMGVGPIGQQTSFSGVTVYVPSTAQAGANKGEESGAGTGTAFVVNAGGYLVTCAHVVHNATKITVHLGDKDYPAEVNAYDPQKDLAVLHIAAAGLPSLPLCNSDNVELGQDIRAVGYPLSDMLGETVKITRGTVCGLVKRGDGNQFQVDASINPGNSGGPLVDNRGRVVGIARALIAGEDVASVGVVIPSNDARNLLKSKNVSSSAEGAGADLPGPELLRRVAPAVALVKVTTGRGGVGSTNRHVVRYTTTFGQQRTSSNRLPFNLMPSAASGLIVVDDSGEISEGDAGTKLPVVFGGLGRVGIESLPEGKEKSWHAKRITVILLPDEREKPSATAPQYNPAPRPPYQRRPPPLPHSYSSPPSRSRSEGFLVIPALEQVAYHVESEDDSMAKFVKEYELTTLIDSGKEGSLKISGSGTVTWDKTRGFPRESKFSGSFKLSGRGVTLEVPLSIECDTPTESELAQARARVAPLAVSAAPAPRSAPGSTNPASPTQAEAPRDPVRKITTSPSLSPTRRFDNQGPRSGLDQFRPDE